MIFQLLSGFMSAKASMEAGKARQDAANMDAFNTETEREQGEVFAMQQAAARRAEFDSATEANIAMFSVGRDIGSDRSVEAFLNKQKEIAATDLGRLDNQRRAEASARTREAMALRRGGRVARRASLLKATGTIFNTFSDASKTAANGGTR